LPFYAAGFGVRGLGRAFGRRLVAVKGLCGSLHCFGRPPAKLWEIHSLQTAGRGFAVQTSLPGIESGQKSPQSKE
jgi:hypothetical protein